MVITSWGGSALIGSSSAPLIFAGKALKLGVGLTGKVFAINYTTSTITNFYKKSYYGKYCKTCRNTRILSRI